MKVLFIIQSWEPEQGPAQWRIRRFVDALSHRGNKSQIITSQIRSKHASTHPESESSSDNLDTFRVSGLTSSPSLLMRIADQAVISLKTVWVATHFTGANRASIVVSTVPAIPSAFAGFAIARFFKAPFVIDLRDAWPDLIKEIGNWNMENKGGSRIMSAFVHLASRAGAGVFSRILKSADLITTTSDYLTQSLRGNGHTNVITVRNTPNTPLSAHEKALEQPYHREPVKVLYAGTVGRAQGLTNAVKAVRLCQDAGVDVHLRIVGDGAELDAVRAMSVELRTPVEFFPPVLAEEMDRHYQWCNTCLVHLRDWEPLERTVPSKLMETMARGLPISLAANGEAAEIVRHTHAGEVAPAMHPEQLAEIWIRWAREGIPAPDTGLTHKWLANHADPQATSNVFIDALEAVLG